MNVLVVGGAGFVGGAVTDVLLQTDHSVRVFDQLLYEDSYLKRVPFVRGDITNLEGLLPHLGWADCVVWLAARVAEATCDLDPSAAEAVNVGTVKNLGQRFDGRIVFTSTSSVYGRASEVLTEESKIEPRTLYARTKMSAELQLADRNAIIFRLGTLYGLGDQFSRPRFDLVVNTMTLAAATVRRIIVNGGQQYRPFLHVRDAAEAIVSAIGSTPRGVFNLHGENLRISELATRLQKHFSSLTVDTVPGDGQLESYQVSSHRARRELNFAPMRTIDSGISEVQELVESGRIPDLSNPRFRNHLFLARRIQS